MIYRVGVLILVLGLGASYFLVRDTGEKEQAEPKPVVLERGEQSRPSRGLRDTFKHEAEVDDTNRDTRLTRYVDGTVYLHEPIQKSRSLHLPETDRYQDLEILDDLFRSYRQVFKENPVGTENEEFMASLTGENPKKVVVLDPALLEDGKLLDRWGSPYRFHSVSATELEISSLGPDQVLWTDDDLVFPN